MSLRLAIVGGSVRAACQSARRAGIAVALAADLFGDLDVAPAGVPRFQIEPGYANLADLALFAERGSDERKSHEAPTHWLYTGAMENHVEKFAALPWPLLGNSPQTVRELRDPFVWTAALQERGIATAALCPGTSPPESAAGWIKKPLHSAAGYGVLQPSGAAEFLCADASSFFQQRIEGESLAGVFVADANGCRLLGVTQQVLGMNRRPEEPFIYLGSVGPVPLSDFARSKWQALGTAIAAVPGVQGMFGVDAIWTGERLTPIEINPRYTASIEVLERASVATSSKLVAMREHLFACGEIIAPAPVDSQQLVQGGGAQRKPPIAGKLIVYANDVATVGERFHAWVAGQNRDSDWPSVTDLPCEGMTVAAGEPICTVHMGPDSESRQACLERLMAAADEARCQLDR